MQPDALRALTRTLSSSGAHHATPKRQQRPDARTLCYLPAPRGLRCPATPCTSAHNTPNRTADYHSAGSTHHAFTHPELHRLSWQSPHPNPSPSRALPHHTMSRHILPSYETSAPPHHTQTRSHPRSHSHTRVPRANPVRPAPPAPAPHRPQFLHTRTSSATAHPRFRHPHRQSSPTDTTCPRAPPHTIPSHPIPSHTTPHHPRPPHTAAHRRTVHSSTPPPHPALQTSSRRSPLYRPQKKSAGFHLRTRLLSDGNSALVSGITPRFSPPERRPLP